MDIDEEMKVDDTSSDEAQSEFATRSARFFPSARLIGQTNLSYKRGRKCNGESIKNAALSSRKNELIM